VVPELRQMRYVLEVARQRSFTRAAERLYVAQQALSQQVKVVEDQVGARLFERTNRGVELTPAGEVFVHEARRVVNAADRLVGRTQAAARGEAGSVRLAYTVATVYETLPAILDRVQQRYPALTVTTREVFGADVEALVLERGYELALCPRTSLSSGLARHELRREPFVAAMPDAHPLAARKRLRIADLEGELLEAWPREMSPGYFDAVLGACRDAGFEPRLDPTATGSSVWGNIVAGRGVGLVVGSLAAQVPRGITLVDLADDAALVLDAICLAGNDIPAVRTVLDAAAEVAVERGWT